MSNCAREPIHVPGFIQPFGILMALPSGSQRISQVSSNTEGVLGLEPLSVLGQTLQDLVGPEGAAEIHEVFRAGTFKDHNPLKVAVRGGTQTCNCILHQYDGLDFVELEPVSAKEVATGARSYQMVQGSLTRLQQSMDIPALWDTITAEVQRITGYDRVMVYKFDRDDHGMVIAEKKRDGMESFLGLHYPASDIPEQARRLYRENWIRYIPDARYTPSPLIPVVDEDHRRLTDMTHCVLRAVSPVHCEYLRNMGVSASLSVSILRFGRLWGLIACHHETPRYLPYEFRAACELLGQVLSIRIAALEDFEENAYRSKTNTLQARFIAELPLRPNFATALVAHAPNLLDFIPATGAAVFFKSRIYKLGRCPEDDGMRSILVNTLNRGNSPIFATNRLQDRVIEGRGFTDTASGVLCFTVSKAHDFHVFWFRTEQVQVVHWGGEPAKPVEFDGEKLRLAPRKSFEVWKQEVRGKSEAWQQSEIEAAAELRATLMSLLLADEKAAGHS
ncbi:MAG TPA: GAF domain-containing protein [Terracidiphilus sp.]